MDRTLPALTMPWHQLARVATVVSVALLGLAIFVAWRHDPIDAYNYWRAWDGGLYDKPWFGGCYCYSPLLAQLIWPVTLLPFEVFRALLMAASLGALVYMVGPLAAGFVAIMFPGVVGDLGVGSPHLLIGAALVAGVRGHTAGWAFLPLTKVLPAVTWLWLLRDRRLLLRTLAFTAAACAVSFVVAPHLWIDWLAFLAESTGREQNNPGAWITTPAATIIRLPIAVLAAGIAAWRGWPWLLPAAAWLALPVVWGAGAAILLAAWPLSRSWRA